jgi:hypothetical protein
MTRAFFLKAQANGSWLPGSGQHGEAAPPGKAGWRTSPK